MDKAHIIENVSFTGATLRLRVDGRIANRRGPLFRSLGERHAGTEIRLRGITFGYGIHWPQIDEDLSLMPYRHYTHARSDTAIA